MFTQLALNKILFMVELLISEHIYLFTRNKKPGFPLRIVFADLACLVVAFFFPILEYNAIYASIMFFLLLAVTVPFMKLCYDEPWITILFCCFAAFTVKEIAYAIAQFVAVSASFFIGGDYEALVGEMLLGSYGNSSVQVTSIFYICSDLTFYSVTYLVFGLIFASKLKKEEPLKLQQGLFLLFAFLIVAAVIMLNALVVYHSRDTFDQLYYQVFMVFMIFGCITALVLQFSMLKNGQLEDEVIFFSNLLREKEKQYLAAKESVDIINQKCHDMKHMIRSWREGKGIHDHDLMEIESAISIYDSAVKTGNETLDIILTEKSLSCSKYGITISCLTDAEDLSFMRDADIYALFGNILDNAIEAVKQTDVPDKRVISLNVKRVNEMLLICVTNYFEGALVMEDGLPQTTKGDDGYHGFGLRSVKRIAENYGGSMTLDVGEHIFRLSIIFPSVKARSGK